MACYKPIFFLSTFTTLIILSFTISSSAIIVIDSAALKYPKFLKYDNSDPFVLESNDIRMSKVEKDVMTLYANNTESTFWIDTKNSTQGNVKYIEDKFRVIDENKNNDTDNHSGIVWFDGHRVWYVFLRDKSIAVYNSIDKEFAKNQNVVREHGIWYTIKIAFMTNAMNIYLDDFLKIHISNNSSSTSLYKIGIRSNNDVGEFEPILIG
jgi:hypothetical protein